MGIIITACDQPAIPTHIILTLECDQASEFFCRGVEQFTSPEGYVGCHSDAMAKGWLERQVPQGRLWLCPACSGKQ